LSAPQNAEPDIIRPEQARQILEAAITERLGPHWRDEETGWSLVSGHDYMARLTRGEKNVDFYVDLLGSVTVTESEINAAQQNGRLIAWALLLGSLLVAALVAWLAGYL
jgi:hypothetical protein